jgi:hypothetical protein
MDQEVSFSLSKRKAMLESFSYRIEPFPSYQPLFYILLKLFGAHQ